MQAFLEHDRESLQHNLLQHHISLDACTASSLSEPVANQLLIGSICLSQTHHLLTATYAQSPDVHPG